MARSTLTMIFERSDCSLGWHNIIDEAMARIRALYDRGYIIEIQARAFEGIVGSPSFTEFEVTFAGLGNYIGPHVPPDTLEEISG